MNVEAAILVLSDMHFGRDLYESPEKVQFRMSQLLRVATAFPGVQRYIEKGCQGHSQACVKKLPLYLNYLLRQLQDQGYPLERDGFDLCILLGDQVTIPEPGAYKFLREYLTKKEYKTTDGYMTFSCRGLGIDPANLLAIPGNHDKLLLPHLNIYNKEFASKLGIQQLQPQSSYLISRIVGGRELLFILVEASVFASSNVLDVSCRRHLACGSIPEDLEEEIRNKLDRFKNGEVVDGVTRMRPYSEITKIMLVHYAVDPSSCRQQESAGQRLVARILPHECDRIGEVVKSLGKDYQVSSVLHGHLHSSAIYDYEGVQVLSAATATQDKSSNGFFVLKVLDTGELRAEHHTWNGAGFVLDSQGSVNQKLTDLAA